jgi:hypothetical protein
MLSMDVFNQDIFSAISMSKAVDKLDYVPGLLGSIPGLFVPEPVRTDMIWIEERATGFVVLQTSPRGTAPHQTGGDKRKARAFRTVRVADASRITAAELQGIRAFGSDTELKQLGQEVNRRQFKMKQNFDLTWENLRMGAVTGVVKDADGSTIYDWAAEFGQAIPAEINFDLAAASPGPGALKKKCNAVVRSITKGLKGVGVAQRVVAIVGDDFWDALTTHSEVEKTYANWEGATALRGDLSKPWAAPFRFGNIDFINYRSTDTDAPYFVGVAADRAKFFPVGAGIFRWAMSPGERFEHVNTLGQETYSAVVLDKDRNSWADIEMYGYPLPVCTMPQALASGRAG